MLRFVGMYTLGNCSFRITMWRSIYTDI